MHTCNAHLHCTISLAFACCCRLSNSAPYTVIDQVRMLDEFCTSSLVRVGELEEILVTQHVISRAEFDTLFRHLHSLAGNAAMMTLDSLSDVATELEHRITRNKKALTRENLRVAEESEVRSVYPLPACTLELLCLSMQPHLDSSPLCHVPTFN